MTLRDPSRQFRPIVAAVALAHLALVFGIVANFHFQAPAAPPPDRVIELVNLREILPPPLPPPPDQPHQAPVPQKLHEVLEPATTATAMAVATDPTPAPAVAAEPDYLPQSKITEVPVLPTRELLARIKYPEMAARMELQATVVVELYIDQDGRIRKIDVLKDPGNGFADAAVKALEGLTCQPAKSNGQPVAVRFRYPVRFTLK